MNEELRKLITELRVKKKKATLGGGPKSIEKQHEGGRLTARERIDRLLDPSTFVEMKMLAALPDDHQKDLYGDGIVVGYGKIDGRKVCIYAQDYTVKAGTTGPVHRSKITGIIDQAIKTGVPVIGLWNSAGGRLDSENKPLPISRSSIFFRCTQASGIVPQISAILGPGGGQCRLCYGFNRFCIDGRSKELYLCHGTDRGKKGLGRRDYHGGSRRGKSSQPAFRFGRLSGEDRGGRLCPNSGITRFIFLQIIWKSAPRNPTTDDSERFDEEIGDLIPTDPRKSYDMKRIIVRLLDKGIFLEAKAEFARNIITGFGRLNGYSVGIVANQPLFLAGSLTIDASDKEARFIRFCDAFNIPLIFLVDTTGFLPGSQQEHGGILRHGQKSSMRFQSLSSPKLRS